jgi:hypothetical protein
MRHQIVKDRLWIEILSRLVDWQKAPITSPLDCNAKEQEDDTARSRRIFDLSPFILYCWNAIATIGKVLSS